MHPLWSHLLSEMSVDELEQLMNLAQIRLRDLATQADSNAPIEGDPPRPGVVYFQREFKRCGKPNCRCMNDGLGHGPYWYAYHYEPEPHSTGRGGSSRVRKVYIGKRRPSPLTDTQVARGSGSVERSIVTYYDAIETRLQDAIDTGQYETAREIAQHLPGQDDWFRRIERAERADQLDAAPVQFVPRTPRW